MQSSCDEPHYNRKGFPNITLSKFGTSVRVRHKKCSVAQSPGDRVSGTMYMCVKLF